MLDTPYPSVTPGPPRPSRILTPRDLERHHGRERHVVPGGGALMLRLGTGDRLTVVNDEGGQIAELIAATHEGRIDAAILGQAPNSGAEGLKAMLALGDAAGEGLARLRRGIAAKRYPVKGAACIGLNRGKSPGPRVKPRGIAPQLAFWVRAHQGSAVGKSGVRKEVASGFAAAASPDNHGVLLGLAQW